MSSSALVVVHGAGAANGASVKAFMDLNGLALEQLSFSCAAALPFGTNLYTAAFIVHGLTLTHELLSSINTALTPGAPVFMPAEQDPAQLALLQKALLLGGFINSTVVQAGGLNLIQATKPKWEQGAKSMLLKRPVASLQSRLLTPTPTQAPAEVSKAWKLSTDDDGMVDEDDLLTPEDKVAPAPAAAADCSTSRKACKDCSCGRAEEEAAGVKVQLTQAMLDNPQTNCGSCSLGDAFRCGGCPYRGLPAFEAGKKITLASGFLTADA